ncbi:hypothetical protein BJY04DRAFT_196606 [Aspergillus karnatakaensis]|uniref:DUF3844 domain-containing protein n=1 Tax=Aspergillus karnatakaensis TaxID=1810916 RepID=UPI003CCE48BC
MRSLFGFLTTVVAVTAGSAASEVSVFTFGVEAQRQSREYAAVSSDTLQQLLELRGQSSTTSTLEPSDESIIELLSTLSGPSSRLFRTQAVDETLAAIVVILEGLGDDIDSSLRRDYSGGLVTSAFAAESARDDFIDTLLDVRLEGIVGLGSEYCSFSGAGDTGVKSRETPELCLSEYPELQSLTETHNNDLLRQVTFGESWINKGERAGIIRLALETDLTSKVPSASLDSIESLFSSLQSLALTGKRATAVVVPGSKKTRKLAHSRRAFDGSKLDLATTRISTKNTQPHVFTQRAKVPLALAPLCYASNSTCNEATNSCSGHGACYKKSGSESEAGIGDCYSCRCHATYVKNEDGTERKVQWGGSACQKKDISSSFFLIAGVTVTIIVVVSAAIGMLFSVGNTELPGVISAGVGAVRTQK